VTHDDLVSEIMRRATRHHVLSHYCAKSLRCRGDRGMPDLLLVGAYGAAWVEVKTFGEHLEPSPQARHT
jgi:hypothetical protein